MQTTLFISMALFVVAIPVSADQPSGVLPQTAQFGARRPAQKNPYAKLFEARDALNQAPQQVAQDAPKKTVMCGMTMIEADPHFDAKMRVTPPKDANVRYAIRAVDPPVCNPVRK